VTIARVLASVVAVAAAGPFGFGCSSGSASRAPSSADPTRLVVGLQGDSLAGALGALHVTVTRDAAPVVDTMLDPAALPHEIAVSGDGADAGGVVAVEVEGYAAVSTPGLPPVLVRTARAAFVPGEDRLLRVILQAPCLLGLPGGAPGGPACTAPQTCIDGTCQDDTVTAAGLEPYESAWATEMPDICKPLHAGPAVVQVGTGQTDYLPVTTGQTVTVEQGPQGGHHVWVAVRQHNLEQNGSTTTITSVQPGGPAGPTTSVVFGFSPDEGGFCKLSGLRYQLDVDGADYHPFLGKPLDITVSIKDPSGATGTATAHVNIAPNVLCPSGVLGCP
jgi:hypothetical protein